MLPGLCDYCLGQSYQRKIKDLEKQENQASSQAKKIRQSIIALEDEINKFRIREKNLNTKLNKIKKEIKKTKNELKKLQTDIKKVISQKGKAHEDLKLQQKEASRWNGIASREAGYLYRYGLHKKGRDDIWLINAISAKKFKDYIKRQKYMKAIISQKTSVLQRARKQCEAIVRLEKKLDGKEDELKLLTKKRKKTQGRYEKKRKEQDKLLSEVRRKRKKAEVEIKELEKSAASLQKMVDVYVAKKKVLISSKEKKAYTASTKGTIIWPIAGGGKVVSLFGKQPHPELPGTSVINRGIKIKVPSGNSVISVKNGNVLFANEFKGYGKMIIIDHGKSFYSIYGQLSEFMVRENDIIQKRQTIAKSGSVLYFEIRMDGKPEDPLNWLK